MHNRSLTLVGKMAVVNYALLLTALVLSVLYIDLLIVEPERTSFRSLAEMRLFTLSGWQQLAQFLVQLFMLLGAIFYWPMVVREGNRLPMTIKLCVYVPVFCFLVTSAAKVLFGLPGV